MRFFRLLGDPNFKYKTEKLGVLGIQTVPFLSLPNTLEMLFEFSLSTFLSCSEDKRKWCMMLKLIPPVAGTRLDFLNIKL